MSKCGKEWAKNDPEGLIKAINGNKETAALVNKAGPGKLKNFMRAVGKDAMNPFGWIGGEILFSTMFSAEAQSRGKTPLEALDDGVLWFLPKGVIDAQKKALFGFEGVGPGEAFKMEGHAGGYNQSQINDMKDYLDMEEADRKYWEAANEKEAFKTASYEGLTDQQVKNNIARLENNMSESATAASDAVMSIYENNTGLRTDGTPRYEDFNQEELNKFIEQTGENLWGVQQKHALAEINRAKQGDLNLLYAKKDEPESELWWGMGPTGRIATSISDPIDSYRAMSPLKASEGLPGGVKQGWQYILDLWNMGLVSQEEKERYAKEMGRDDLLQQERQYHPDIKYGTTLDYEDMQRVYPEYFNYAGGGIAGIRRPWAIPPESGPDPQGLASMNNYVTKRTG
jgi:hypothetical protein